MSESWDGRQSVGYQIKGGYVLQTANRRDITLRVAGLEFYFDTLTIGVKEKITPIHGSSRARPYALLGGDIDGTAKMGLSSWLEDGDGLTGNAAEDKLRNALFDPLNEGRAVYFTVGVDYNGDLATGGIGRHSLVQLLKCKAEQDSWDFGKSPNQSSFDLQFIEDVWFGRKL